MKDLFDNDFWKFTIGFVGVVSLALVVVAVAITYIRQSGIA